MKVSKEKKQKGHKAKITKLLPIETVNYQLTQEEQICPKCNNDLYEMKKEIRKELKVILVQVMVTEHVRYVYACRNCDKNGASTPTISSPMLNPVIKNSLASPSMLAHIMNRKYVEARPLYRQEQQFKKYGLKLSRQTLANWMIKASNSWLKPLYKVMHEEILKKEVLHSDETVLEVLCRPDRPATINGYIWLYRTSGDSVPIVLYEYAMGRSGDYAKTFLKGFRRYLHKDGYGGYHKLQKSDESQSNITLIGCWAHARGRYDEALKAISDKEGIAATTTHQGIF